MCSYSDQFIQTWHSDLMREHSLNGKDGNKLKKNSKRNLNSNVILLISGTPHCVLQSLDYVLDVTT